MYMLSLSLSDSLSQLLAMLWEARLGVGALGMFMMTGCPLLDLGIS